MVDPLSVGNLQLGYEVVRDLGRYTYYVISSLKNPNGRRLIKDLKSADTLRRFAIIGLGGSGKTTLLRTITRCNALNPEISNLGITPVYLRFSEPGGILKSAKHHCFIFVDCEGQRFDKWAVAISQAGPDEAFQMGTFDGVVFVVDLAEPPQDTNLPFKKLERPDWNRLTEHVDEWSDTALDFVYAHLGSRLKFAALFVNKTNLLSSYDGRLEQEIYTAISPLVQRINNRSRGHLFKTYIGDANSEQSTKELKKHLIETEDEFHARTKPEQSGL